MPASREGGSGPDADPEPGDAAGVAAGAGAPAGACSAGAWAGAGCCVSGAAGCGAGWLAVEGAVAGCWAASGAGLGACVAGGAAGGGVASGCWAVLGCCAGGGCCANTVRLHARPSAPQNTMAPNRAVAATEDVLCGQTICNSIGKPLSATLTGLCSRVAKRIMFAPPPAASTLAQSPFCPVQCFNRHRICRNSPRMRRVSRFVGASLRSSRRRSRRFAARIEDGE